MGTITLIYPHLHFEVDETHCDLRPLSWFLFLSTVPAQILDAPANLTVIEPQNATFSCLATGRPRPDITWFRLSAPTPLQPPSADFIIGEELIGAREKRSNLTIIGTQPSDAGTYSCMAVNGPGINVEQATLTVHGNYRCHLYSTMYVQLCRIHNYYNPNYCIILLCSGSKNCIPTNELHLCCGWN